MEGLEENKNILECRNISFMSTVAGDKWFSRIYSPPVIAQFLNDVNLEAKSGEIHAVCGVSGSGKSTLLKVVANSADGDTSGSVYLNQTLLTKSRFCQIGSFVNFYSNYPSKLTVRNLLYYNLKLCLGGSLTESDIEQRTVQLMREFEISSYAYTKLFKLSESARRRVLIALAAAKDPVLLILDDPCKDIEALSAFQLMNCLQSYARLHNRIIFISIQSPRSDIYQLITTITILFYGEVFYSGYTKNLPAYFKKAGFPCPSNENPAAYYITIATIDRETATRCDETQEQAMLLVNYLKEYRSNTIRPDNTDSAITFSSPSALCYLTQPTTILKLFILCRRSLHRLITDLVRFLLLISVFPLAAVFLSLFSVNMLAGSWTVPHSSIGFLEISVFILSIVIIFLTNINYRDIRDLSYFESSERLYSQMISAISHLLIFTPIYIIEIAISTFIIFWMCNISDEWLIFQSFILILFICFFFQYITMIAMILIKNNLTAIGFVITIDTFLLIGAGGHLRSFVTMSPTWFNYFTYLSPYRYSNYFFISNIISRLPIIHCSRTERNDIDSIAASQFCRWNQSASYMDELYSDSYDPSDVPSNCVLCFMLMFLSLVSMLGTHFTKKSKYLVHKFKYH